MNLSLAQMQIRLGQPQENFAAARGWIEESARRESQLLLLPELWTTGYDLSRAAALAVENQALLPELAHLARLHKLFIGGSLLLEERGSVYNTFLLFSPDQQPPAVYRKVHLFRLMDEDRWLAPGNRLSLIQAPWGSTGFSICYDLRFPEMFRRYALAGARLFLLSAEWPRRRIDHWKTLLRARAIENQAFMAAVNATGPTGGEDFGGSSALISPWGETLLEGAQDQPALLTASIDLDQVDEVRAKIPVFKDRRPELYESQAAEEPEGEE